MRDEGKRPLTKEDLPGIALNTAKRTAPDLQDADFQAMQQDILQDMLRPRVLNNICNADHPWSYAYTVARNMGIDWLHDHIKQREKVSVGVDLSGGDGDEDDDGMDMDEDALRCMERGDSPTAQSATGQGATDGSGQPIAQGKRPDAAPRVREDDPSSELRRKLQLDRLYDAIDDALTPKQAEAMKLRYPRGDKDPVPIKAVAAEMGETYENAKQLLSRGKRKLRQKFQRKSVTF